MRQQALRQELTERKTADEGDNDPGDRNRGRGPADLAHQLEVGLHAGQQQQQQNAELRDAVEQGFLFGGGRKERVLRFRPDPAEERGSEQQTGQQFADDRGLANALHQLTEPAADGDQERYLHQQKELRRPSGFVARGACHRDRQEKRYTCPKQRLENSPSHRFISPLDRLNGEGRRKVPEPSGLRWV